MNKDTKGTGKAEVVYLCDELRFCSFEDEPRFVDHLPDFVEEEDVLAIRGILKRSKFGGEMYVGGEVLRRNRGPKKGIVYTWMIRVGGADFVTHRLIDAQLLRACGDGSAGHVARTMVQTMIEQIYGYLLKAMAASMVEDLAAQLKEQAGTTEAER